jgi:hypothetical protein
MEMVTQAPMMLFGSEQIASLENPRLEHALTVCFFFLIGPRRPDVVHFFLPWESIDLGRFAPFAFALTLTHPGAAGLAWLGSSVVPCGG